MEEARDNRGATNPFQQPRYLISCQVTSRIVVQENVGDITQSYRNIDQQVAYSYTEKVARLL